ncbi:MAG TPA: hypothetical protein VK772_05770 [Puia sp.]|nr:hypothetical protein [Puia sp.]
MKERFLYEEEFEKQLKEKADQFKMYPSDKVWSEVNSSIHPRSRKFVVGMTILIGGILVLAGNQLISPSKNLSNKLITSKVNVPAKSAATEDPDRSAANDFAINPSDNSNDQHSPDQNQNTATAYVFHSGLSSDRESPTNELLETRSGNLQSVGHQESAIQPPDLKVSAKSSAAPLLVPELNDEQQTQSENPAINTASSELAPVISSSQSNRIQNEKLSWQLYITPTLNTHYLNGISYQTVAQSIPSSPIMVVHFANVNGLVDNTPMMGYNLGGNILYKISKNISLKVGLEFSFNRYNIKTYNSNPYQASTRLNTYLGYFVDSLANSNSGITIDKNQQQYQNRYYQLSLPIGVEMKVAGKGKLQLHLGATLQPSYLLNTDAYVLSDDYSSYIKDAQAFRRWNLIAGTELYLSYSIGKIRWEIGPQVRYQIFSTYRNSYPLQENMVNYGIRFGISKSIR